MAIKQKTLSILTLVRAAHKGCKRCKISINPASDGGRLVYSNGDLELVLSVHGVGDETIELDSIVKLEQAILDGKLSAEVNSSSPVESPESTPLSASTARKLVWVAKAADAESTRYALGGVSFDGQFAISTDGRRLHAILLSNDLGESNNRLVPSAAIELLAKCCKPLTGKDSFFVEFAYNTVKFYGPGWVLFSRLIEGRFPNWKQVIPDFAFLCTSRVSLGDAAIEHCKAVTKKTQLANKLLAKGDDPQLPKIRVGGAVVNSEYLSDALDGLLDGATTAICESVGASHPVIVGNPLVSDFAVIMTFSAPRNERPADYDSIPEVAGAIVA